MQADVNQRKSSFNIAANVFINEKPTTLMIGNLNALPFEIQQTIDYLRRNAVTFIVIYDHNNNPIENYNRDLKRRFNACYSSLQKNYNHEERTFTDNFNAEQRSQEVGASTYNNDEVKIICNEIKSSKNIESVVFRLIEDSKINLEHLIAAIDGNPSIKEVSLQACGKSFVSAINKIAENRDLKVVASIPNESEIIDEVRMNSEKLPERKTNFFANIDSWQVIDGFIALVGIAALALALIVFEAASLNPVGIGVGIVGAGLLGVGLNRFFSQADPLVDNKEQLNGSIEILKL